VKRAASATGKRHNGEIMREDQDRVLVGGGAATRFPEMSHTKAQGWKPRQRKEVNEPILDNWNFVQVKFLSLWCKGEALPPSARLIINRMKRG